MAASRVKNAKCVYVGDDEVFQHIVNLEGLTLDDAKPQVAGLTLKLFKNVRKKKSVGYAQSGSEEDDSGTECYKPSQVLADDGVVGSEIFSFKTPKKSGQMAVKACEATPCQASTLSSTRVKKSDSVRPTAKKLQRKTNKATEATPYRLRKRIESGSSDESSGSDDNDSPTDGRTEPGRVKANGTPIRLPESMAEEYFAANNGDDITSDRTLSRLKNPRMDQETMCQALKNVANQYQREVWLLMEEHRALFTSWMFQLCNGFNILVYGLGSKRHLLDHFRQSFLQDFLHVVINGYFPSITIKNILTCITEDTLGLTCSSLNPVDQLEFLRLYFQTAKEHLYIVVHNIDGPLMRSEKVQAVLSQLATIPRVHFIASIDHINAPLVWDQTQTSRFNWVWHDTTTFMPYSEETSYENSLLVQQSGALALSSLTHVMRSLTPNAKGIFKLLVVYQLEHRDNSSYLGMSFQDLYQKCREAFLVNSDLTLRAQLTEFRDHKLIRSRKGLDGVEHLFIPLEPATLDEFITHQGEL